MNKLTNEAEIFLAASYGPFVVKFESSSPVHQSSPLIVYMCTHFKGEKSLSFVQCFECYRHKVNKLMTLRCMFIPTTANNLGQIQEF